MYLTYHHFTVSATDAVKSFTGTVAVATELLISGADADASKCFKIASVAAAAEADASMCLTIAGIAPEASVGLGSVPDASVVIPSRRIEP